MTVPDKRTKTSLYILLVFGLISAGSAVVSFCFDLQLISMGRETDWFHFFPPVFTFGVGFWLIRNAWWQLRKRPEQ